MKIYENKRYMRRLFMLICLLILAGSIYGSIIYSNAAEDIEGELIILIDNSGSVHEEKETLIQWTAKLGAFAQDMGIKVHLWSFDDIDHVECLYSDRISSNEGQKEHLQIFVDALKGIAFDKQWTDQKGAFERAQKEMESSDAQRKCIIMLSDGVLDYKEGKGEEEARGEFKKCVNDFGGKKNQEVLLLKVKDETGTNIYEGCKEAEVLNCKDLNEEEMEEILWKIFGNLGIDTEKIPKKIQNNMVQINVNEGDYRSILNINSTHNIKEDLINDIAVDKNGTRVDSVPYSLLGNSCFMYFSDVGEYTITMPDADWKCYEIKQKRVIVNDIKLTVKQGNSEMISDGENIYHIYGKDCILLIDVITTPSNSVPDLNYLSIAYRVVKVEEAQEGSGEDQEGSEEDWDYLEIDSKKDEDDGRYSQFIDLTQYTDEAIAEQCFECQVRIKQGNAEYKSDKIIIKVNDELPSPTPSVALPHEYIEVRVKEKINIETMVPDDGKIYTFFVREEGKERGEDEFRMNGSLANGENCCYQNKEIQFIKEGSFVVSAFAEDYDGATVYYKVVGEKSLCEKIKDWLSNLMGSP